MKKDLAFTIGTTIPYFGLLFSTQGVFPKDPLSIVIYGFLFGACMQLVKYGLKD